MNTQIHLDRKPQEGTLINTSSRKVRKSEGTQNNTTFRKVQTSEGTHSNTTVLKVQTQCVVTHTNTALVQQEWTPQKGK